ncbi:hypothetical protein ACT29H_08215 [Thermophagus sp. OGC60D27]|uniref:hypothetical protein n=1 Tax=Thermophagus sp. OGC60D27 TaxID=3458415 RepID=UPI00403780F4
MGKTFSFPWKMIFCRGDKADLSGKGRFFENNKITETGIFSKILEMGVDTSGKTPSISRKQQMATMAALMISYRYLSLKEK